MKQECLKIGQTPAIIYGDASTHAWLFVHGMGGNKTEAEPFAALTGAQVLAIDLPGHGERKDMAGFNPWTAAPELRTVMDYMRTRWRAISLQANSIGAYFSMLALSDQGLQKALFVSPVVNMERLILDMMDWAGVTETQLRDAGEIATDFGQTLSWQYLSWVREHPLNWHTHTAILYAGHDNLTSRDTIMSFANAHQATLSVYEPGEHWFHTPDQLDAMTRWEKSEI